MTRIWKNEQGVSLLEMIVLVVIIGIALPSLLTLIGEIAVNHSQNEILLQGENFASEKIEEIFAFKNSGGNWTDTISEYAGDESLGNGFTRTTQVNHVSNWNGTGVEVYHIVVTVTQPRLRNGFSLTLLLTDYEE